MPGPLDVLREWVRGTREVRPVVVRAANSSERPAGASVQPWTDPSAGLVHVNTAVPDRVPVQSTEDLAKHAAVGRPGAHHVAMSWSATFGLAAGVESNDGRRTVIGARPSAPTRPRPYVPVREDWAGTGSVRTAPGGQIGDAIGAQEAFGPLAVPTRTRYVPPTDALSQGETSPGGSSW